jgi:hypothetical protein
VIDLAKFISELGKPGPYAIRQTANIQRWQWMKEPSPELVQDVPNLEHFRELVLASKPEQWSSLYAKVSGALPLVELRSSDQSKVAILQGEVQVHEAGKVSFRITTSEKFSVWLDDKPMDEITQFESILEPGKHKISIRVGISGRADAELKVDVVKSRDSVAQFEVVGGP